MRSEAIKAGGKGCGKERLPTEDDPGGSDTAVGDLPK
jgi:hypothetical protein